VLWLTKEGADTMPSGTVVPADLVTDMQGFIQFYAGVATLHLYA